MGIVKYTGPMASFHCPTNAEIRSLKVHFSPKQGGSGDPSPENVRPIIGWDGVETYNRGKNIWDEQWEVGALNYTTGLPAEDSSRIRTKNFNPILPNTSYYFLDPTNGGNINVFWYDINKTFIKISGWTGNIAITSPSNAYYFKFIMAASYGAIYNHNISINYPATDTFYKSYQGETTNYEFGVLGKNKADPTWESGGINTNTGSAQTASNSIRLKNKIKVFPGATYVISWSSTGRNIFRFAYKKDGTFSRYLGLQSVSGQVVTLNYDEHYLWLYQYDNTNEPENLQVELGSTATTYEPYDPKNTVYGGWVDLISGEVVREWLLNTHTIAATDGTPGGTGTGGDTNYRFVAWNLASAHLPDSDRTKQAVCDIVPNSTRIGGSRFWLGGGTVYMILPNDNNEYSATVAYAERDLNTTTYHLAPTQLQTFLGQNNVWSNADYVEVEYDLHETQDILARKQFIVANQPHIVTPAAAPLQNFVTDMVAPLKECKVYFSPVQEGSGDPSPENVRAITGWTEIEVTRCGKNLYNPATVTMNYEIGSDGNPLATGSSNNWCITDFIPVKQNTTYIATALLTKGSGRSAIYNVNKEKISTKQEVVGADAQTIINVGNDGYYVRLTVRIGDGLNTIFEESSSTTAYEPYSGTTIPIDWTTEAGTVYGGYVDLVTGEVWKTWTKRGMSDFSSTTTPTGASEPWNHIWTLGQWTSSGWEKKNGVNNLMSDILELKPNPSANYQTTGVSNSYPIYIYDSEINTAAEFKEKYVGHYIAYELRTPTLVTILTPTALKTLRGTNNIWSNANGNIELKYWAH